MEAAPGNEGVTMPVEATGIVVGVVDTYSRASPVRMVLFLSRTVATRGCAKFWVTVALVAVVFGTVVGGPHLVSRHFVGP